MSVKKAIKERVKGIYRSCKNKAMILYDRANKALAKHTLHDEVEEEAEKALARIFSF